MVVDRVFSSVVGRVVELESTERHVTHGCDKGIVGDGDLFEPGIVDHRIRVEVSGDSGGHRINFDADDAGGVIGAADEGPGAGSRLQDGSIRQAGVTQSVPHGGGDVGCGVVGRQGRAAEPIVGVFIDELLQLGAQGIPFGSAAVEDLRARSPG